MKKNVLSLVSAFGLCTFLLSGCYTVVRAPGSAADVDDEEVTAYERVDDARIGKFSDRGAYDDFYGYPGAYRGSGYGYPIFGAGYGGYGGYGYGGGYYGGGYSPYSYGYDPYYRDTNGYYIPPGFELVSTRELELLRASQQALPTLSPEERLAREKEAARRLEEQKEDVWLRRVEPRVGRPSPPATPQPAAISAPVSNPPPASTAQPAPKPSASESGSKPKKTRR